MKRFAVPALIALFVALVGIAIAADTKAPDIKCPVSGEPADMGQSVDFDGGKVYFCCDKCPGAFNKDTAKYAAKAHLQMVETGQLKQTACPLTGKEINPEATVDVAGVKVAFCCMNCKGKVAKAQGDEQINLVFKDVSKGFKKAELSRKSVT